MSLAVEWSPACNDHVLHLSPSVAGRVCEAVGAFAADGSGHVEATDNPTLVRLRAGRGYALIREEAGRVYVFGIYANPPARRVKPLL